MRFAWPPGAIEAHLDHLYDDAAAFINDAGMSWQDFWNTPRNRLRMYASACNRRIERQREELPR